MTPWAARSLSADDKAQLEERAAALGVTVSVISSRHRWTVRVFAGRDMACDLRAMGSLAAAIAGALDDFEALPEVAA